MNFPLKKEQVTMNIKNEVVLMAVIAVITALFVANFTILFKIHDDQQIIKNKIDLINK